MAWRHEMVVHHRPALTPESAAGASPRWVSQVIEPGHTCTEIVPSFNIVSPAGGGFDVSLRARRAADGRWSSWRSLGSWGNVPVAESQPAADEWLKVCVDTLQSRQPIIGVQYAITAHGRAEKAHLHVERFALCFSGGGAEDEQPTPRLEDTSPIKLDVPFRSQFSEPADIAPRLCSPTCVAMVLDYYGVDVSTRAVASACYDERHDLYGNWSRAVQAAFTMGVGGAVVRFDDWAEVYATLRSGRPIVASIAFTDGAIPNAPLPRTEGHLVVICGVTVDGDVYVNDPAAPPGTGTAVYAREPFGRAWFGHRGTAYVFDPPTGGAARS